MNEVQEVMALPRTDDSRALIFGGWVATDYSSPCSSSTSSSSSFFLCCATYLSPWT